MDTFAEYLASIDNPEHRRRMTELLDWTAKKYPALMPKIGWNQPMFTDHGTYIIGFSVSKQHIAIAPEVAGLNHFSDEIVQAGYDHTKMLMRIRWDLPINYSLLEKIIEYNILDKADCQTFWRE